MTGADRRRPSRQFGAAAATCGAQTISDRAITRERRHLGRNMCLSPDQITDEIGAHLTSMALGARRARKTASYSW